MNATNSLPNSQNSASVRTDAQTVLRSLEELAQSLQPGDLLPSQLELIRHLQCFGPFGSLGLGRIEATGQSRLEATGRDGCGGEKWRFE